MPRATDYSHVFISILLRLTDYFPHMRLAKFFNEIIFLWNFRPQSLDGLMHSIKYTVMIYTVLKHRLPPPLTILKPCGFGEIAERIPVHLGGSCCIIATCVA